jgi:hypothetical protein
MITGEETEVTYACRHCGAKYNTHHPPPPLRTCYECEEPNPWQKVTEE